VGGGGASGGATSSGSGGKNTGGTVVRDAGGASGNGSGGRSSGGSSGTGGTALGGASGGVGAGGSGGSGGAVALGGATGSAGTGSGGLGSGAAGGAGGTSAGGNATGGRTAAASGGAGGGAGGARPAGGTSGSGGASAGGQTGQATGGMPGSGGGAGGAYHACPGNGAACKIMPFGDSITDGFNADTPGGYRVQLFHRALSDGKSITFVGSGWNGPDTVDGVAFPHNHEGHSGWTIYPAGSRDGISECLSANQNHKCLATNSVMSEYKPDIVLLMIGTNDAIDNYDMPNAPKRLGDLIDTIYSQLPSVLVVVAQPIPSRGDASKGDDTNLSARIKTFNDAIPAVVQARADAGKHILLVDMYTPFNPSKTSLLEDQWHPNKNGYVILGDQWYSVLKPLL
jgi:lysophospholipase L1-like esterase